jgi:HD superfamily phosphohydrolase
MIQIRDPIHGTIHLSPKEILLVDHPAYQRLRAIKQLGLADFAFPGATHTRYAHGLGTMHIGSKMFESIARHFDLSAPDRRRLGQTLRLASLFHDLGHAPLSHTTEGFMPPVGELELGEWLDGPPDRRASHEDFTLKLLTDSDLTRVFERAFADEDVTPVDVACLIAGRRPKSLPEDRFRIGGRDWSPLLEQCVSSELDADRMDYLLRDSYYAGVPYGRYDHEWLLENLVPVERHDTLFLGLEARASFGFEDFLLSRYHMFMSVYFHHVPIGYEAMLRRFYSDAEGELVVPSNAEDYLFFDDVHLFTVLRRSASEWARRIVERRAYRMLVEVKETVGEPERRESPDVDELAHRLEAAGIDVISTSVQGVLSKYSAPDLFIVEEGRPFPVQQYTPLYRRYAGAIRMKRIYVDPERFDDARRLGGISLASVADVD